jgi:hypothetical protein
MLSTRKVQVTKYQQSCDGCHYMIGPMVEHEHELQEPGFSIVNHKEPEKTLLFHSEKCLNYWIDAEKARKIQEAKMK